MALTYLKLRASHYLQVNLRNSISSHNLQKIWKTIRRIW